MRSNTLCETGESSPDSQAQVALDQGWAGGADALRSGARAVDGADAVRNACAEGLAATRFTRRTVSGDTTSACAVLSGCYICTVRAKTCIWSSFESTAEPGLNKRI
eukprot:17240-Heterococcus_DN1.PRE.3